MFLLPKTKLDICLKKAKVYAHYIQSTESLDGRTHCHVQGADPLVRTLHNVMHGFTFHCITLPNTHKSCNTINQIPEALRYPQLAQFVSR